MASAHLPANVNKEQPMKHCRWLAIGTSLFLCATFLAPLSAEAAHKSNAKSQKAAKIKEKKPSAARLKANKKITAAKVATSPKSKNKSDASEREVWLKRARFSEALSGKASWYGEDFHNKSTASGLAYDMHTFTAAHRTLPIGTVVKVTDQNNGKSVIVCVTDRGPFVQDRIIDVSYAAATQLGLSKKGVGKVQLEVVSDENGAPLKKDQAYFVKYASAGGKNKVGPFRAFADAAAMHEALMQAHPEAEVILEKTKK